MLMHLMLELYGCSREVLTDEPLLRRVLDEYPGRIDMEKVSPVHLYDIETSNPLDAGMSGFVVIAQSHISMHGRSTARLTSTSVRVRISVRKMLSLSRKKCSRPMMWKRITLYAQRAHY